MKKPERLVNRVLTSEYCAGVAELVDALVLGTSGATRGGSSPLARTVYSRQ